ncbi:NAD(P)-binding protein [Auricularia subglabra TFB-10046 SS5]|nr:NAD(P)-binding protein [Auricularia subglabra TFB-10046 SS5]
MNAPFPEVHADKPLTVLVTGPTSTGIGATTLTSLARSGPEALILAGRTPSKFQSVIDEIKRIDSSIKVVVVKLDLASLAATRQAAQDVLSNTDIPRIDVLVNNAGIMCAPFEKTADGIESHFHANHVGHFLFTNLLMPKLRAAPEPVIVNVTSSGHRFGTGDFSDYNFEKRPFTEWDAYGQSKCANVLFTQSLVERGFRSLAVHPGYVGTDLHKFLTDELMNELLRRISLDPGYDPLGEKKDLAQGSSTQLVAALDPAVPNGAYLRDCQLYPPLREAVDKENARKLWELSCKLVGESFA